MGHGVCLQPWTQVSGNNQIVSQSADDWLELIGYQDVAIYLDVAFLPSQAQTTLLQVETSPSLDPDMFLGTVSGSNAYLAQFSFSTSPFLGVQPIQIIRFADAGLVGQPLGRYLRWRISFPPVETAMAFRIWLTLNPTRSC